MGSDSQGILWSFTAQWAVNAPKAGKEDVLNDKDRR